MVSRKVIEAVEEAVVNIAKRCADPDLPPDDVESLANGADYLARVLERVDPGKD